MLSLKNGSLPANSLFEVVSRVSHNIASLPSWVLVTAGALAGSVLLRTYWAYHSQPLVMESIDTVPTSFLHLKNGGKISYTDYGETGSSSALPAVFCLPGIGDVRHQYRFLVELLQTSGFRVITADLRGLGQTSTDFTDFSAAAVGSDTVELLQSIDASSSPPSSPSLSTRGAVILGNSMAAAASVWVAAELPYIVRGIVPIGPFVRDLPMNAGLKLLLKGLLSGPWAVSMWGTMYRSFYKGKLPADFAAYKHKLLANLKEPKRAAILKRMLFESKEKAEKRIKDLKCPALVVMGEKDPNFSKPQDEVDWILLNFPAHTQSRAVIVPQTGHYPHVESPEKVAKEVIAFARLVSGSPP